MCDPVTMGMTALNGISRVAQISTQNQAAAANASNAKQAANDEIATSTEQYIEQNRSLIQGGFDAVLEGRANEAVAYASAIQNGVQGSSVKAMLRDRKQKTGRSETRTSQEIKSLSRQAGANLKHIGTKTQARINSTPTTSLGLGDVATVLTPIVRKEME